MYPVQLEKYLQWNKRMDEEADRYDKIFNQIEGFNIQNLAADLPQIQSDTARVARNDTWLKDRQKDVQLYETVQIVLDMLHMDALAGKH